jgi:hypothetical protein
MRARPPATTPGRATSRYAIALYRISTTEQGQSGLGMEAQHRTDGDRAPT